MKKNLMVSLILIFGSLYFLQAIIFLLVILFIGILIKLLNLDKNKNFYARIFSNKSILYSILIILFLFTLVAAIALIYKLALIFNKYISINLFIIYALLRTVFFIYKRNEMINRFEEKFKI